MEEALESRNVPTEFVEVADDVVYVGYRTQQTDAVNLFTELQAVVRTVLEQEPGAGVVGAVFHNERPTVGTWRVDAAWAEQWQTGGLPETALTTRVLHTLRTVQF